jgi:hypothetical protein
MGILSFCLGNVQRRASSAGETARLAIGDPDRSCDTAHHCERPISLAELIAASAFLDFGSEFDERHLSGRGRDENRAGRK